MAQTLGLIGLGLVGKALAGRLLARGYDVLGYDVDPTARLAAEQQGVTLSPTPCDVGRGCGVVLLSLPNSDIVREVLWEQGLAEGLGAGALVLDTTTGRPQDAEACHTRLAEQGVGFCDVTLSGSSAEIAAGEATALVGGDETLQLREIVGCFARRAFYLRQPGAGCLAKLVVNHVMGLNRAALAEGLALGQKAGLAGPGLLQILRDSAADSRVLAMKGERMVSGSFEPASRIAQHEKDVRLILDLADQVGAAAPLERVHLALLQEAVAAGWGELDNAALIKVFERDEGRGV